MKAAYEPWEAIGSGRPHDAVLKTLSVDLLMAAGVEGADLVHTHTWYANFAGHLARLLYDIPHVATSHSLEPRRPWKAEQLGGGYAVSSFCERTALEAADAVIAVSGAMRDDILDCYPGHRPRPGRGDPQRRRHRRVHPRPRHRRPPAARHRPGPALRHLRGADHPAEGHRPAARRRRAVRPRHPARAPPQRPRHARGRRGDAGPGGRRWPSAAGASCGWSRSSPDPSSSRCCRTRPWRSARRSTNRSVSSTWRPWPAPRRWWPPTWAASPRSSSTARPARSCISSSDGRPARRPGAVRGDLAEAVNALVADSGHRRTDGGRRPEAGGRGVLLALHRRADRRALPIADPVALNLSALRGTPRTPGSAWGSCPTRTGTGSGTSPSRRGGCGSSGSSIRCSTPSTTGGPAHFWLDGQTAVIDDYLAVRPAGGGPGAGGGGRRAAGRSGRGRCRWTSSSSRPRRSCGTSRPGCGAGPSWERRVPPSGTARTSSATWPSFPRCSARPVSSTPSSGGGSRRAVDATAFRWEAPDGSAVRAEYLYGSYANGQGPPAGRARSGRRGPGAGRPRSPGAGSAGCC